MLEKKDVELAQWARVQKVPTAFHGETANVFVQRTIVRGPSALAGKDRKPVSAIRLQG